MTWPYENDTSAITKKLAKKSLQILTASGGVFRRHDLRNKNLFVLDQLIAVGVKRGLRYVNENRNLFIHIALTNHTTIALGNIGRPPRTI